MNHSTGEQRETEPNLLKGGRETRSIVIQYQWEHHLNME